MQSMHYRSNLNLLAQYHPRLVKLLEATAEESTVEVVRSASGHPVPVFNKRPIHSLQNPIAEGLKIARAILSGERQQRLLFFGFGFGYQILPCIELGFSPVIFEPCLPILKQAFVHLDLCSVIPHVTIHAGEALPDVPRATKLFMNPRMAALFPRQAKTLQDKIITANPPDKDNMETGIYYGTYRNVTCLKNPCDLFVYQMICYLVRPTLIIEIGACRGGSAFFFADMLRLMGGDRRVHTYDVVNEMAPEALEFANLEFHPGGHDAFDPSIIKPGDRVLIVEDSSHTYENTLQVIEKFAPYVTPNSYLIVEDGRAGDIRPYLNGGPIRAIQEFMASNRDFEVDTRWEKFFGSANSNCCSGFLRRKATL